MSLARSLLIRASRSHFLARQLPRRAFVRRAVRRFMPGEDFDAALSAARELAPRGIAAVFTELGEQVTTAAEAAAVRDTCLAVLDRVAAAGLGAEVSVKLTHLGLDLDRAACAAHLEALAARADALGNWLFLDMEESHYVDATLDIYRRLKRSYPRVGVCLQACLYRTGDDLEALAPLTPGIRLVKGAYREAATVAWPRKRDVDDAYLRLGRRMLDLQPRGLRPVFGTHDAGLIGKLREHGRNSGLDPKAFEFHLLYGIRSDVAARLAGEGAGVRVLIAWGKAWFAWYMRRLAERPANVWFVLRNLV
jgi:proline dehydrogenase